MNSSEEDSDLEQAWNKGCAAIIPEKSRERYENTYQQFKTWCIEKSYTGVTEKVMLAYFVRRSEKLKSSGSLWAEYSMLKSTIFLNEGVDISKFSTLIAFIKRKTRGYRAKKAKVFAREEMYKFLKEFPDEIYLNLKVGMIFGIAGACRREELYNMKVEDVEDHGSFLKVNIPKTKNNVPRTFTVIHTENEDVDVLQFYRKYIKIRPLVQFCHLFLSMRNGKVVKQVVGINTIGSWPSTIAKCLNLPDPLGYTGHSFRRTSATLLANKGVDVLGLKRHGGWRSSTVAEGYVEDAINNKLQYSEKILTKENEKNHVDIVDVPSTSTFTEVTNTDNNMTLETISKNTPIQFNNCSNCTFSFVFNNNKDN